MTPRNPMRYSMEDDRARLQLPHLALPSWATKEGSDVDLFCVPIGWRRIAPMPPGRDREAWCLWGVGAGSDWIINPGHLMALEKPTPVQFALQTMIYPAKYDSRGRFSCAQILFELEQRAGSREFWVAPEVDSVSIWTDVAFQYSYARLT